MKIVHITPGSGGTFYCQNCFRDNELVKALQSLEHEVYNVPMYLPLNIDKDIKAGSTPVFYGAVNVYLKEKISLYRLAPEWLEKLMDSDKVLQYAAKKSGSTRAAGLEEMTISMLKGEDGRQASELDRLIKFLKEHIKPDVVHLSNGLLLGLAHRIKKDLGAKVICSLQDENEWIDPMAPKYQDQIWDLMAEKAHYVDRFITASKYYADRCHRQLKLPDEKMEVVYSGINLEGYETSLLSTDPPVIGYLCRMAKGFGLDILVDAFLKLKNGKYKDLKLMITGGYTADDLPFVEMIKAKISQCGYSDDVTILENFCKENRTKFLSSLTLLSVPVPAGEAFGAYMIEALASGVPVVQPNVGCYPEFVNLTKGGVIYEPNNSTTLAENISALLDDKKRMEKLGETGQNIVDKEFTVKKMAENTIKVYQKTTEEN